MQRRTGSFRVPPSIYVTVTKLAMRKFPRGVRVTSRQGAESAHRRARHADSALSLMSSPGASSYPARLPYAGCYFLGRPGSRKLLRCNRCAAAAVLSRIVRLEVPKPDQLIPAITHHVAALDIAVSMPGRVQLLMHLRGCERVTWNIVVHTAFHVSAPADRLERGQNQEPGAQTR